MDFSFLIRKFIAPVVNFLNSVLLGVLMAAISFLLVSLIRYRVNPFRLNREKLLRLHIRMQLLDFIRWKLIDRMDAPSLRSQFREFGLTLYVGRQGHGKSISMVHYLARMRRRYPKCIIVANFACRFADYRMETWEDFFKYRNGEEGVIFAIDEIHSEYASAEWKNFPESLLSEISQQRKQRIKIVASSQVFTRVVKPIREQAMRVVVCFTFMRRWTFNREYDAVDFALYSENPSRKIKSLRRLSFVQSDDLRASYDTYEKIIRMRDKKFIPRDERGQ